MILKEIAERADSEEKLEKHLEDHTAKADCPGCGGTIEKNAAGRKVVRSLMTMTALNAVCPGCGFAGTIGLEEWFLS